MLALSPWKILVIVVVALLVLGPEKLPSVARQVGAFWGDFRRFRARLENEVRGVFPDLPPSHEVASAVRSPLAYLNRLADEHERQSAPPGTGPASGHADGAEPEGGGGSNGAGMPGAGGARAALPAPSSPGSQWQPHGVADGRSVPAPDDPSMN